MSKRKASERKEEKEGKRIKKADSTVKTKKIDSGKSYMACQRMSEQEPYYKTGNS